jgi:hypothetical protein
MRRRFTLALEYQKAMGLEGLGFAYEMPEGVEADGIEHFLDYLSPYAPGVIDPAHAGEGNARCFDMCVTPAARVELANTLTTLNPTLWETTLNLDDPVQVYNFIMGATTGIHPLDIDFYINADEETQKEYQERARYLEGLIFLKTGKFERMYWIVGPVTLEAVYRSFKL